MMNLEARLREFDARISEALNNLARLEQEHQALANSGEHRYSPEQHSAQKQVYQMVHLPTESTPHAG